MAQTHIGAMKTSAKLAGVPLEEYLRRVEGGEKRCRVCTDWKPKDDFNVDKSRHDGRASLCRECHQEFGRNRYIPAEVRGRKPMGPSPKPGRDGDKLQARARVNILIQRGKLVDPNLSPCKLCGHLGDDRRHEYHHHKGYEAKHHLDVEVVCTVCHRVVDPIWKSRKRNTKGQLYGPAN